MPKLSKKTPEKASKKTPEKLHQILADWKLWGLSDAPIGIEQLKPLSGGLNNQCFLLECAPELGLENRRFVLRIAGTDFGLDRSLEFRLHTFLAEQNLTARIHYCAPDYSYWLRPFVEGTALSVQQLQQELTLPAPQDLARLKRLVQQLRQIHQLPVPDYLPTLQVAAMADYYWQQMQQLVVDPTKQLPPPLWPAAAYQALTGGVVVCHLDPTPGNWIATAPEQELLLDWEYAALAHPLLDVAALVQQLQLSPEQEQRLLASYYQPSDISNSDAVIRSSQAINKSPKQKFSWADWQLAKSQMRLLEVLWHGAQGSLSVADVQSALQQI